MATLELRRSKLYVLTVFLKEHCHLGKYVVMVSLKQDSLCRLREEEDESPQHMTSNCTSSREIRPNHLDKDVIDEAEIPFMKP